MKRGDTEGDWKQEDGGAFVLGEVRKLSQGAGQASRKNVG